MRRVQLLIIVFSSISAALGAGPAAAQSLAGSWTISNSAPNSCPGQLQINPGSAAPGDYTGFATFACGSDPAVNETFDIAEAHGTVTMRGHDASGPWCTDNYALTVLGDDAMTGTAKDGCGATGTVFLSKAK